MYGVGKVVTDTEKQVSQQSDWPIRTQATSIQRIPALQDLNTILSSALLLDNIYIQYDDLCVDE